MKTITAEQALDLLRKARDDYGPDYKDPTAVANVPLVAASRYFDTTTCEYLYPNGKMCIAGHVLHQLGVPLIDAANWEGFESVATRVLYPRYDIEFEQSAIDVICAAQGKQDEGWTWGDAVEAAEHRYDEYTALAAVRLQRPVK
jgi:hypothetical protein